jgi:hypothetical protein
MPHKLEEEVPVTEMAFLRPPNINRPHQRQIARNSAHLVTEAYTFLQNVHVKRRSYIFTQKAAISIIIIIIIT